MKKSEFFIVNLLRETVKYKLEVPAYIHEYSIAQLTDLYNGVGSDDTPKEIIWYLTKVYRHILPSVLIHDLCYTAQKDTKEKSDRIFHENNIKLIDGKFNKWYQIYQRLYHRTLITLAKNAVEAYGKKWEI